MNTLSQRVNFNINEYQITDKGLLCKVATPQKHTFEIKFEELFKQTLTERKVSEICVYLTILPILGLLVTTGSYLFDSKGSGIFDILFYLIGFIFMLLVLLYTYESNFYIFTTTAWYPTIGLSYKKKNKKDVDLFMSDLFSSQKEHFIRVYITDTTISKQQINANLLYMLHKNIIDQEELETIRDTYLKETTNRIGFNFYSSN